jgi:hypothetical protein
MSFVFLSHASPDKAKIRHIVDALIAAELKVWLDDPAAIGFTPKEIQDHFYRLEAGGPYRPGIHEGLRRAGAVLVCWSEKAVEPHRRVLHSEVDYARIEQKLIACRIDDVDKALLPDRHAEEQIINVRPDLSNLEARLSLLIHDIQARMASNAKRRVKQRLPRDSFAPYLIDRTRQEDAVASAIDAVARGRGVRAFLIAGPENECVDEFLERIARYTCPQQLGGGRSWLRVNVEWPSECHPTEFGEQFRCRLARRLGLRANASGHEITQSLSQRDRPVAAVSLMGAQEWKAAEPQRIKAWLSWWRQLDDGAASISVIPILSVKLPPAKPGWRHYPRGWTAEESISRRIWRQAQELLTPTIDIPPMLHPVNWMDVERWCSGDHFEDEPPKAADVASIARHLFMRRCRLRPWVTVDCDAALEDFAKTMKPMFHVGW